MPQRIYWWIAREVNLYIYIDLVIPTLQFCHPYPCQYSTLGCGYDTRTHMQNYQSILKSDTYIHTRVRPPYPIPGNIVYRKVVAICFKIFRVDEMQSNSFNFKKSFPFWLGIIIDKLQLNPTIEMVN